MFCDICHQPIEQNGLHEVTVYKTTYRLCEWDALKIRDQLECTKTAHMANIFWGAGHISWTCWYQIREYLRRFKITEVLEFGIGLSSELFVNEGLKVIGFDACQPHVDLYQNLLSLKNDTVFHYYKEKESGPNVEELYPGRKWEFVFVDGPQERSKEVAAAMRVATKFIYLHDPNMGEQSFFPTEDWIGLESEPKLFIKKGTLLEK